VRGGLAAVDVQDLARDKGGLLEVEDAVDHVADVAYPTERVQGFQYRVRIRVMQWGCDGIERDSVDSHAA